MDNPDSCSALLLPHNRTTITVKYIQLWFTLSMWKCLQFICTLQKIDARWRTRRHHGSTVQESKHPDRWTERTHHAFFKWVYGKKNLKHIPSDYNNFLTNTRKKKCGKLHTIFPELQRPTKVKLQVDNNQWRKKLRKKWRDIKFQRFIRQSNQIEQRCRNKKRKIMALFSIPRLW